MSSRPVTSEPAVDPSDPYAREAQTFPQLRPEMAERVAAYGTEERLPDGTPVFERGQRSVDFFFVLEGAIEIFDTDDEGRRREAWCSSAPAMPPTRSGSSAS